ncbi:26173_t:CDS:2 [Dentiscutata erythropus]|uniref:26173_t:CDS:1 n=1 Tax=Dentiscutata erythropus TaxID=1348616 RepID=A0A9N9J7L5_9GLOM|nr:26173_t:CDS:2 [Dentiscutata erythropus]
MCHILKLVVKESLKEEEISSLQKKVYKIMKYLFNPLASSRLEVLELYCRISKIDPLRPILKIDTHDIELIALEQFCQLLKPFENAMLALSEERSNLISDAITLEHLYATLIKVSRYSENDVELFVENIQIKIISYGMKYTSKAVEIAKAIEKVRTVEINDNSMDDFLYPRRRIENKGIILWESLSKRFPILARMARNYLYIKPSSVSSERAFSRAGFTITSNRASISEEPVSSTILLHSWLIESQNKFSSLQDLPF